MKQEPSETGQQPDFFAKKFYFITPFLVPLSVFLLTFLFYPICPTKLLWLPLKIIYWVSLWIFTLFYRSKRGGVFTEERFKFTLKLKGDCLWLQYLAVYGPLLFNIPLFIILYAPHLSLNMILAIILASLINGPSEEIYWRSCLDEAGQNAGISNGMRLFFTPIVFALWHTAFIFHLYPHDGTWFRAWLEIMAITWSTGLAFLWVMHRSGRIVPQSIYHTVANTLHIFPMILITVVQHSF